MLTNPQLDLLKVENSQVRQLVNHVGAVVLLGCDRVQQQAARHFTFTALLSYRHRLNIDNS